MVPVFPDELPQMVASFLERFVMYDPETEATCILTHALDHPIPPGPTPVILDIDVARELRFSVDDAEVWSFLERLRGLKNRVFFGSLTEATVELYQ